MKTSSPCCRRRTDTGITLIEVVASLALLSMLLVGILKSFAANQKQLTLASQQRIANTAMDELLAEWFESPEPFPVNASGVFGDEKQFAWKTSWVRNIQVGQNLPAQVIRVQVSSVTSSDRILSMVEIVDRLPESAGGRP